MSGNVRRKGDHSVIVKRSAKKEHEGHHSGGWKVAFADFTLAMMCLFMVLWIINSEEDDDRIKVVDAVKNLSIFDGNLMAPLNSLTAEQVGGIGILPGGESIIEMPTDLFEDDLQPEDPLDNELEQLAKMLETLKDLHNAHANLSIAIVPEGLRLQIQDDSTSEMFQRSSFRLSPFFHKLLLDFAPVFESMDNVLIITGHTDSAQYRNTLGYNNWNLSSDRAMEAMKVLIDGGLSADKVFQVSAMADRVLVDVENPESAKNRRIEILILTKKAENKLNKFFGYFNQKEYNLIAPK